MLCQPAHAHRCLLTDYARKVNLPRVAALQFLKVFGVKARGLEAFLEQAQGFTLSMGPHPGTGFNFEFALFRAESYGIDDLHVNVHLDLWKLGVGMLEPVDGPQRGNKRAGA
jgi:hypothetical protein